MATSLAWTLGALAVLAPQAPRPADVPLADYFRAETAKIAADPLFGIESAAEWKARRPELQRRLREMLGIDPLPKRTPLGAKVTGRVERPDFLIEKVVFQSSPGLFVTADLFRPKAIARPLPAVLYVCGHGKEEKDGVIFGNKAHYRHHAAWYAANGYVCLIVDTLELGEVPGVHHGTYREGMWWWHSRGYTPAGVEAWNGIRAIDYLESRLEVDKARIGVTGRSGGGATSWWLAAIDDRVAAVVPVAGITDLKNHVADGVVDGHCDCMYFVNTYRWDFPLVAALVAPKPLLVENTDKDPIFPEDGVRRIYAQLEKVYDWYGARDKLGLVIGKGGHADTEEIRHPSFAFMNKWLRGVAEPIAEPDRDVPRELLKVLGPGDAPKASENATIQVTFVPEAKAIKPPKDRVAWQRLKVEWRAALKEKVFGGWPGGEPPPLNAKVVVDRTREGLRVRAVDFDAQEGVRPRLWLVTPPGDKGPEAIVATLPDEAEWRKRWAWIAAVDRPDGFSPPLGMTLKDVRQRWFAGGQGVAVILPRGTGALAWDPAWDTRVRRRFALLGQTLQGMQVWDARRALAAISGLPDVASARVVLSATGENAALACMAAAFEDRVKEVVANRPTVSYAEGPALLNVARVISESQIPALVYPRRVRMTATLPAAWEWTLTLSENLNPGGKWLVIEPGGSGARPPGGLTPAPRPRR